MSGPENAAGGSENASGGIPNPVTEFVFSEPNTNSVFNQAIKTITGSNKADQDKIESDFKRLSAAAIAQPSAISGLASGTQQTNIRGNSIYQIGGIRKVTVVSNDDLEVKGYQNQVIDQDSTSLYKSNRRLAISGSEDHIVNGRRDLSVIGASSLPFAASNFITVSKRL